MRTTVERANNLTSADVQEILRLYPDTPTIEIARKFGKDIQTIYKTANRYGVNKSEAFHKSEHSGRIRKGQRLGIATEFKKGHVPGTKGKKQSSYMSSEGIKNSSRTRWTKEHRPHNEKKDGDISVRRMRSVDSGRSIPYKFIRISKNKWEFLHRHLWQKHVGPIPNGYNVIFKDGDTMNCTIENLDCISNADLARRNSVHNLPEDLRELIHLKRSLTRAINNATKE